MDWERVLSSLRHAAIDLKQVQYLLRNAKPSDGLDFPLLAEEIEDIYGRLEGGRRSLEVDREVEGRLSHETDG